MFALVSGTEVRVEGNPARVVFRIVECVENAAFPFEMEMIFRFLGLSSAEEEARARRQRIVIFLHAVVELKVLKGDVNAVGIKCDGAAAHSCIGKIQAFSRLQSIVADIENCFVLIRIDDGH